MPLGPSGAKLIAPHPTSALPLGQGQTPGRAAQMHRISCTAQMPHWREHRQTAPPCRALRESCPAISAVDSNTTVARLDYCVSLADPFSRMFKPGSQACRSTAALKAPQRLYQNHISERGHLSSWRGLAREPNEATEELPRKACTFR